MGLAALGHLTVREVLVPHLQQFLTPLLPLLDAVRVISHQLAVLAPCHLWVGQRIAAKHQVRA